MFVWNLTVLTSLPRLCQGAKDLYTTSLCFADFENARAEMRRILSDLSLQNNAMFDGKGRIKHFHEYIERFAIPEASVREDERANYLTREKLSDVRDALLAVFSCSDAILPLKEGVRYSDGSLTAKIDRGRFSLFSRGEARLEGVDPVLQTNCFSMEKEQDYYLRVDGRFLPGCEASAFLSLDLTKREVK